MGRPPIRSAPPGAGPSGAGETAAGHPTPGEQAAAAAWRPMELLIEVTPDINSSVLSLLYGPTLTSTHDYWKTHSLDYPDLCWQK